jgi:hypothetical protein
MATLLTLARNLGLRVQVDVGRGLAWSPRSSSPGRPDSALAHLGRSGRAREDKRVSRARLTVEMSADAGRDQAGHGNRR